MLNPTMTLAVSNVSCLAMRKFRQAKLSQNWLCPTTTPHDLRRDFTAHSFVPVRPQISNSS